MIVHKKWSEECIEELYLIVLQLIPQTASDTNTSYLNGFPSPCTCIVPYESK